MVFEIHYNLSNGVFYKRIIYLVYFLKELKSELVLKLLCISSHIDTTVSYAYIIFMFSVAFSCQIYMYEIFLNWITASIEVDEEDIEGKLLKLHSKTAVEEG